MLTHTSPTVNSNSLISVRKVASQDNIADVLTKALPWKDFAPKAARLMGIEEEEFMM